MHLAEMEMEIQSATGAPNWYALFTRHQHEKSVAFALSNKNHEVYLPLYRSVRRWQDRAKRSGFRCSHATCLSARGWTGSFKYLPPPV